MKELILCLLLLVFSVLIKAQDTIFVKSGARIPAVILEKGDVELKYKKFDQPEPAGIYTIFNSDIASIHYKNGTVEDFSLPGRNSLNDLGKQKSNASTSGPEMRFNIGVSGSNFSRTESDNLQLFWGYINNNSNIEIGGNKRYYSLNMSVGAALDANKRNWFGASVELTLTPADAIYSTNTLSGLNEIKLRTFNNSISMFYGHTLNHKKNLVAIFEPGIMLGMMSGDFIIHGTTYKVSGSSKAGAHLAIGFDWFISRRLQTRFRIGEQFMMTEESHVNSLSSTGYSTFYVNQNINDDLVSVKWNGPFVSLGLAYSFYMKVISGTRK